MAAAGDGGGKSDGSSSNAACLALRIATVALSVASAVMMASASQRSCTGCSPATASQQPVSYRDYSSLSYSLVANVVSAALQALAAWLTASGKADKGKVFKSLSELVDTAAQVLLYSSSALSFSVDDFGTCGRRVAGVCKAAGEFCQRARASGAVSIAAAVALAASNYLKDVPVSTWFRAGDDGPKGKPAGCGRGGCHCRHHHH
ncbi:hypothetical protein ZEAMMB73_Zm00001d048729 [Zea mays]|uniref:CASP-like protein n=1 Tax=Zea mays TaxID=4577 RepID=K7TYJ7_MAIZE|nr:hypothetical protein ZEAMMB73_Zm00001d048729 [Zea mays]|eukprot:XP_008677916.1 uncharacterized protein LOC103652734 [Zea mays]